MSDYKVVQHWFVECSEVSVLLSDHRLSRLLGCQSIELSDYWVIKVLGCQSDELSDYRAETVHTTELSDYRIVIP